MKWIKNSSGKKKETSEWYTEQRSRKTSWVQLTSLRRNLFWKKSKLVILGIIQELTSSFLKKKKKKKEFHLNSKVELSIQNKLSVWYVGTY